MIKIEVDTLFIGACILIGAVIIRTGLRKINKTLRRILQHIATSEGKGQ